MPNRRVRQQRSRQSSRPPVLNPEERAAVAQCQRELNNAIATLATFSILVFVYHCYAWPAMPALDVTALGLLMLLLWMLLSSFLSLGPSAEPRERIEALQERMRGNYGRIVAPVTHVALLMMTFARGALHAYEMMSFRLEFMIGTWVVGGPVAFVLMGFWNNLDNTAVRLIRSLRDLEEAQQGN